jgi:Na+/proline symporter
MYSEKGRQSDGGKIKSIAIICALSAGLIPLVSLLFGVICYGCSDPLSSIGIFSLAALAFSGALGGVFASLYGKQSKRTAVFICCAITSLLFFLCGLLFSDAMLPSRLMNIGCYAVPYLVFGNIFCLRSKKRRSSRPYKR